MRKLFTKTICALALAFFAFPQIINAQSAIVNRQLDRNYTLNADGSVAVNEKLSVTINSPQYQILSSSEEAFILFNPIVDDVQAKDKLAKSLATLKITDQTNKTLTYRSETKDQNLYIYVKYPRNVRQGSPLSITLNYSSFALAAKTGLVYDIYVPSFTKDFKFGDNTSSLSVTTNISIPKNLGELNFITPTQKVEEVGENRRITFSQADLTGNLAWVQIGTKQAYAFEITQPIGQSSVTGLYSNTYELLLPRDIVSGPLTQTVEYTKIEPTPYAVSKDENGNLKAVFKLPANATGEIKLIGFINLSINKQFDLTNSGLIADIPSDIRTNNTKSAIYWEVDNANIQKAAQEIAGEEKDIYKLIEKTYAYVVERIDYSDVKRFGINKRQGAAKTLDGGAAVCMEYSDLFIALLRAQGIAARGAFGYGYDFRSTNGINTPHQWAEVYLPAQNTWILVDTTWGESGNAVIGADLNHIYKYVASDSPESPAPVQVRYVGTLATISDEKFTITPLDKVPESQGLSSAKLLELYPEPAKTVISQLQDGGSLILGTADAAFTNVFNQLAIPKDTQHILKIVIGIFVIFAFIALLFSGVRALIISPIRFIFRKLFRRKAKKEKIQIVKLINGLPQSKVAVELPPT